MDNEKTITKEAEHGTASIDEDERHPSYAKENPRSKCNDRKIKSHVLNYKATPGYIGDDHFEVQVITTSGLVFEYIYNIKVVGPKGGGRADLRP